MKPKRPYQINERRLRLGFTKNMLTDLLEYQEHRCGACRRPIDRSADLDHDHVTLEVRGLLCRNCNVLEGVLDKSVLAPVEAVKALEKYLNNPPAKIIKLV